MYKYIILIVAFIITIAYFAFAQKDSSNTANGKIINNDGKVIGEVLYTEGTQGILIEIKASMLTPGKHGMHFHQIGTCEDHDSFKMSEGHIIEDNKPHGFLHPEGPHEGNLPNLIAGQDGSVHVELYTELVSLNGKNDKPALLDKDGSALIIHQNEDDHKTQPIGGSGSRIACSVIER